jgi:hypothetical protein
MNHKRSPSMTVWLPAVVLLAAILACNLTNSVAPVTEGSGPTDLTTVPSDQENSATSAPTLPANSGAPTTVPIVHTLLPGELPAAWLSEITDRDSSAYAPEHRTNGGENFNGNLYERPFNANSMDIYFPDLDITQARLFRDSQWVFVSLNLVGQNPSGGLLGNYGVELDLNVDGRGEVLVMAARPGASWSTDGVRAWQDDNHDVGAAQPIQTDGPVNGDGYETLVFDQGNGTDPDLAWARISPTDPTIVQIAFKQALINDDDSFTWGAWSMNDGMLNPAWFDYNDHFTATDAGSPLIESTQYYPLKALAEVDNTCRWVVGFTPTGSEPGICPVPVPPTTVPNNPGPGSGTITGKVFRNPTNGGEALGPASMPLSGVTVQARAGGCASPGSVVASASTNASGNYSLSVPGGTYCVAPNPAPYGRGGTPQTVSVAGGSAVNNVNFGYWEYLGMR